MQRTIKIFTVCLSAVCTAILGACSYLSNCLPDEFTTYKTESFILENFNTISFNNQSQKEIKVNSTGNGSTVTGNLELFNIIPIKEVNVHNEENKYAVPCGTVFGVKFYTKGVVIIKCDDIQVNGKTVNPGEESGLKAGDAVLKIDNSDITCCLDMQTAIDSSNGNPLNVVYEREGEILSTEITPVMTNETGTYKAGIWIRDSCAGLGTMTFYDPESGCFASLGHGICDADTNELLLLDNAEIVNAEISSITKGTDGIPGSINGYFESSTASGQALLNTETGLYGTLNEPISDFSPMEVANIQDVKKGYAQIICTLDDNGPQLYDIEITHVDYDETNKTKNLQITATDERLLEKTGGIVQGMSGSPIIQNGKIVGAVTHVLVANSNKGYGIFAQTMYEEIEKNLI